MAACLLLGRDFPYGTLVVNVLDSLLSMPIEGLALAWTLPESVRLRQHSR